LFIVWAIGINDLIDTERCQSFPLPELAWLEVTEFIVTLVMPLIIGTPVGEIPIQVDHLCRANPSILTAGKEKQLWFHITNQICWKFDESSIS
jgi:hypothetical protein